MSSSLARAVDRYTALRSGDGWFHETAIAPLALIRAEAPASPSPVLYEASLCIVVQGAKQAAVGDTVLSYGAGEYLVTALDVPLTAHVTHATPDAPYLALVIALDPALILDVAQHIGIADAPAPEAGALGVFVGTLPAGASDALERLVGLLATPTAIPVLAAGVLREIMYWLLSGPDGPALAASVLPGNAARRVAGAVHAMRAAFPAPVRVSTLAEAAGMSASAFHAHFKAATALTPGQYYTRLRLLEARRLLERGGETAKAVAHRVGYESASQFSRDYARLFGLPPGRDAAALAASAVSSGAAAR